MRLLFSERCWEILLSANAGIFSDGKYLGKLETGADIKIYKSGFNTVFLRKKEFNFYKRLSQKLKTENR